MKRFVLAAFLLAGVFVSQAQSFSGTDYKTAVGIKLWDGGGISVKHFLTAANAAEGIGYFYNRGFRLTGLYEMHYDINNAQGLKWYVGPGAHVGFYNNKYSAKAGAVFGIDGVIGLDYKFSSAPINLSLDWQPAFEFASNFGFNGSWGGLGIRYTF